MGMVTAFPRTGQDTCVFFPQFWEKCGIPFNGNFNDLSIARESSFQSFLSLQNLPLPGESCDCKDKAVLWETIPCPLGSPLWSVLKWRAEGQILWSKVITRKKRKCDLSSPNYGSECRDPRPGVCSLPPRLFFFLDVKQSHKCDSWSVGILAMIYAAYNDCLLLCIRAVFIFWLNAPRNINLCILS